MINALKTEFGLKDAVSETGLLNIFVAMDKLLLWQQARTCLILVTDVP